jgi:hypothetical protein
MKDLSTANERISQIAKDYPAISPITPDDYPLFQQFFSKEPHTYGNSWTYIMQGMYGIGPNKLGYKYYDGTNLSAVCVYPKVEDPKVLVFYWIRPMGPSILDAINKISHEILTKHKTPSYAKKLFNNQYDQLKQFGFKDVSEFPWHSFYPAEDDTFPEQIYDVSKMLRSAEESDKDTQINRSLRYYHSIKKNLHITCAPIHEHVEDTKSLIDTFFELNDTTRAYPNISDPLDYYSMLHVDTKPQMIENILYLNNKPVGFYVIEKQSNTHASQYATISMRNISNHIVDYMMFDVFYMLENQKIQYLNLGGSETQTLHLFKLKYQPVKELKMYWVTL